MSDFDSNPRRLQELRGRPIADAIYHDVFGQATEIWRAEADDELILDKEFAVDARLTLPSKQILLGQEKFLSYQYAKFASVTIEYMQNPAVQEHGDWFKLAAQIYLVGYFTEDGTRFSPWIMLDWAQVVIATMRGQIMWHDQENTKSNARASFKWTRMVDIPDACIIVSGGFK